MGSYCAVVFDEHEICTSKSFVPDDFCAIFQESDRRISSTVYEGGDEEIATMYSATREIVLSRLNLLGITAALARTTLERWIETERSTWEDYCREGNGWAVETAQLFARFSADEWYSRASGVVTTRYDDEVEPIDQIDRKMRDWDGDWLWFDGYGSLVVIRALLDACPNVTMVTLDISDLINGGYIEESAKVCEEARTRHAKSRQLLAPIVVLAEGSSDIRILQRSLSVLFPERQDYFSFFNHSELNVDGGSSYLIKFLKAFAAARAPFRMVAIFDNDTMGRQAYQQACDLHLPSNITIIHLPDIELAQAYPTIGPQGHHMVDVNGVAGSIELYLGRAALTKNGQLRPVRWMGYDKTAKQYQGEIEGKGEVENAFLNSLMVDMDQFAARSEFPELTAAWETIFQAVEDSPQRPSPSKSRPVQTVQ